MWHLSHQCAFLKNIKIVEFLHSHFNTEDGRKHATFLAYYVLLFQERQQCNWNAKKKKICAVCREGAVTDQMCQKWFEKFCAGDFSLDDAPRLGRPVEVDMIKSRH